MGNASVTLKNGETVEAHFWHEATTWEYISGAEDARAQSALVDELSRQGRLDQVDPRTPIRIDEPSIVDSGRVSTVSWFAPGYLSLFKPRAEAKVETKTVPIESLPDVPPVNVEDLPDATTDIEELPNA